MKSRTDVCVTDFHSHIIPRLDHGSRDVQTSLWQISQAKKAGISRIVASSHFYANVTDVNTFLSRRERCLAELKKAIGADAPEIIPGAEVLIFENLYEMPNIEKLCVGNTNVFLAEIPFSSVDESIAETVRGIISRGIFVVLAHADRYDVSIIDACLDAGAKIQLNADGILSHKTRKQCLRWADDGYVYAIGSDIHGKGKNYTYFTKAMKILGKRADDIFAKTDSLLSKTF